MRQISQLPEPPAENFSPQVQPDLHDWWDTFYATRIYLPISAWGRRWRRWKSRMGTKQSRFLHSTSLPEVKWDSLVSPAPVRFLERTKRNGNIRNSELALLCYFAKACRPGQPLLEIGTFDGRTTLNLAANCPRGNWVYTLDLPDEVCAKTMAKLDGDEHHLTSEPATGRRYHAYPESVRIAELTGDSSTFNFVPYYGKCSLVFVDGSHAYDMVMSDSLNALRLAAPDRIVLWHDYGVWDGVTRALEDLERKKSLGLRAIYGTSLVYWRNEQCLDSRTWK